MNASPPPLNSNAYQNSFQQFLNQNKSETTTTTAITNSSDNTFSRKKYIAKPKSETQIMAKKVKKKVNQLRRTKTTKTLKNGSKPVKTKRLKKPQVIKNLTESKSFIDFISKRFPTIKEGVPFIQDRSCKDFSKDFESLDLNFCLDCNDKRNNSKTCRFFQYRKLIKKGDQLSVYAFAEEGNATNEDTKIWLPLTPPKNFCQNTARYLLTFVGNQFCKIYSEERQINERFASLTWKRPVRGIRELCDVCETTIFNTHYVCSECGLAVCVDCYAIRESYPTYVSPHPSRNKNLDDFGWILCNQKKGHDFNAFHLAIFMTRAVYGSIDATYHNIRNEKKIKGLCQCHRILPELNIDFRELVRNVDVKTLYPLVPQQWLSGDRLLVLLNPKFVDNIKLFQIHWLKGFVSNACLLY